MSSSETSSITRTYFPSVLLYLNKIKESKWTHTSLIVGFVALLTIGILASTGSFNFMGAINAAHLAFVMYEIAIILFVAEVIKVVLDCKEIYQICLPDAIIDDESVNKAIRKIKISNECMRTRPCQHGCVITLSDGRSIKSGLSGYSDYVFLKAIDSSKYDSHDVSRLLNHFPKRPDPREYYKGEITAAQVFKKILKDKGIV